MGNDPVETTVKELNERIERLQAKVQSQSRDLEVYIRTEQLIVAAGLLSGNKFHDARALIGPISSKDYAVIT